MRPPSSRHLALLAMCAGCAVVAACFSMSSQATDAALGYFAVDLEDTATTSANASIGDLDDDGHLDIVLIKGRHWPGIDRVLFGDGKGSFDRVTDLSATADRSYTGALADVDLDGDLDVVVSNDKPDRNLVYLNDGHGQFTVNATFGKAQWSTRNIRLADINRDSLPDIVVANRSGKGTSPNFICLNLGNGRFQTDCIAFSNESATTITPSDMNGDHLVDLVVPHRDGGQSNVYLGVSSEETRFDAKPFGPSTAHIRAAEVADFNRDGTMDIVAIHTDPESATRSVVIYFGEVDGTFGGGISVSHSSRRPYALSTADLNDDGATDIIVGHIEAPTTAYINHRTSGQFHAVDMGDNEGTTYGLAIADLNGDGQKDIVAARSGARNQLYLGYRTEQD